MTKVITALKSYLQPVFALTIPCPVIKICVLGNQHLGQLQSPSHVIAICKPPNWLDKKKTFKGKPDLLHDVICLPIMLRNGNCGCKSRTKIKDLKQKPSGFNVEIYFIFLNQILLRELCYCKV